MNNPDSRIKTLVFHDNFAQMGGAERVAEELHRTFPGADLATTLSVTDRLTRYLQSTKIKSTWMQLLPAKARFFRWYFLLYPVAIETVGLKKYDLIVTSCFGYAKGVKMRKDALHICYCHSPMRWVWRTSDYLEREKIRGWKRELLLMALKPLKAWEIRAAQQPDFYIANSRTVARRLHDAFGIESTIIPPPIETRRFTLCSEVEDYYMTLSRLVPYKRIDLAVEACSRTGRRLKVIGGGPDLERLRAMAGPTVEFLGRQSDEAVAQLASRCRALIFPGEEDFGMAPLEVNAAGRPVIAFDGGGASETIVPGLNGIFFKESTVDSLIGSLEAFEKMQWQPGKIRAYAEGFDSDIFQQRIRAFVDSLAPQSGLPVIYGSTGVDGKRSEFPADMILASSPSKPYLKMLRE
jgi:glycosyltransferase involved in cell wall biosynthesis